MTPSASAWSSACSGYGSEEAAAAACAAGCAPAEMREDDFPLLGALVNALHRGVAVRVLSNDFGEV